MTLEERVSPAVLCKGGSIGMSGSWIPIESVDEAD